MDSVVSNDKILDDSQRPLQRHQQLARLLQPLAVHGVSRVDCAGTLWSTGSILLPCTSASVLLTYQVSGLNVAGLQFWKQIAVQKQHSIRFQKGHLHVILYAA